jgi:hypothetical protein
MFFRRAPPRPGKNWTHSPQTFATISAQSRDTSEVRFRATADWGQSPGRRRMAAELSRRSVSCIASDLIACVPIQRTQVFMVAAPSRSDGRSPRGAQRRSHLDALTERRSVLCVHTFFIFCPLRTDIDSIPLRVRSFAGLSGDPRREICDRDNSIDLHFCYHRRDPSLRPCGWPQIEVGRIADVPATGSTGGQTALLWRPEKPDVSVGSDTTTGRHSARVEVRSAPSTALPR